MNILPQTLVLLTCVVVFGECDKVSYHIENNPCATVSDFINKRGEQPSDVKSKLTRRSVGIDENLLGEDQVMGLRRRGVTTTTRVLRQDVHAIVLTDPEGRNHFLKNWLHFRIDVSSFVERKFEPDSLVIQISRRALHPDWKNTAAQGEFVADFPGYEKCPDVLKDFKDRKAVRPSPRQFVPCQGANYGENEYANMYVYNFRAPQSHGGGGKQADRSSFKMVHHLFWKFNENSCSRKHHEFYVEVFYTIEYGILFPFYFAPMGLLLGNVHGADYIQKSFNIPAQASDPLPIYGDNWNWTCKQDILIQNPRDKYGDYVPSFPELKWVKAIYSRIEQRVGHGEVGSCKVDGLEGDESFTQYGDQFYGRCEPPKGQWKEGIDAVYTPSPNRFHKCFEEGNMINFTQGARAPQYGEQFGMKADKTGLSWPVPLEVCGKCPGLPTEAKLMALFPEVLEQERRDAEEKAAAEERERLRKEREDAENESEEERKRREEEEAARKEEEARRREELEREKAQNASLEREKRFKEFTVRFDDEDDGWWPRRWQKKFNKNSRQRQRSPVAMVGLSVWRFRKLHGIFEVIVAFFLTPVCVFVSRYFKETWLGWRVLEQPAWLMGHLSLSIVSLIFHVFGVHSGVMGVGLMGSSRRPSGIIHRYLGFGTLALFVLLNLLGAFRPVGLCARRLCIILHWLFGLLAYALNFACVLTSINIPGSPSANNDVSLPTELRTDGVAIVFVLTIVWIILDILFHVVANVMIVMSDLREEVKRSYFPVLMPCVDEDELIDTEGSFWRKVLLSIYVIVCALMTITVVGVIYSQTPNGRAFFNMTLTHNETGDLYTDLIKENGKQMAFYFPPFF